MHPGPGAASQLGCPQADTDQSRAQQQRLHALLWNHAARYFQAKQYSEASTFFAADLQMSPQPEKPKVARSMAMCCLATGQLDRWLPLRAA